MAIIDREALGHPIGRFQHSRFLLADLHTEVDIARVFVDHCVALHARKELTATRAAKAKYWCTELQVRKPACLTRDTVRPWRR